MPIGRFPLSFEVASCWKGGRGCIAFLAVLIIGGMTLGSPYGLWAQDEPMGEMALMERVAELQRQLESTLPSEQEAAEKELLKLGPVVLDYLEPPGDNTPAHVAQRLLRIRLALEKIVVAAVTQGSKVTLHGRMTVGDALSKIEKQTGNRVRLQRGTPDSVLQKTIQLNQDKADFWTALRDVMTRGGVKIVSFLGEGGTLWLAPSESMAADDPHTPGEKRDRPAPPGFVSGVFDVRVVRVSASRNLVDPALSHCNVTMKVRWEPRVQPISIALPLASLRVTDEAGVPVNVPNPEAVLSGIIHPKIREMEFAVPIGRVDRRVAVLKTFDATLNAVLPGRIQAFRFKRIGDDALGRTLRSAGAIVTLEDIQPKGDLYGVTVSLRFDDETPNALGSHQGWALENRCYLENEKGERISSVGYETVRQDQQQIAVQYFFKQNPERMTLVYKTPALMVRVPIRVHLENIPLP